MPPCVRDAVLSAIILPWSFRFRTKQHIGVQQLIGHGSSWMIGTKSKVIKQFKGEVREQRRKLAALVRAAPSAKSGLPKIDYIDIATLAGVKGISGGRMSPLQSHGLTAVCFARSIRAVLRVEIPKVAEGLYRNRKLSKSCRLIIQLLPT